MEINSISPTVQTRLTLCTAPPRMNHRTAATVVMSKVFHVRSLFLSSEPLDRLLFSSLDYYKLNRLYKALAIQKLSSNGNPVGRGATSSPMSQQGHQARRPPQHQYPHAHQQHSNPAIPSSLSTSPPTPTPMNINQLSPFYSQQSSYLPMPTTITDSRKSKY